MMKKGYLKKALVMLIILFGCLGMTGNVKATYTTKATLDKRNVLYDNGTKEDGNGNECIELVLEAEPLDDSGNSLGQQEAKLMGFYLVNLSTDEVIDEHKTTW